MGTGGAAYPLQLGGVLKEWVEAPSIEPYRKIDGRVIVDAAIGTLERYKPTQAARDDLGLRVGCEAWRRGRREQATCPSNVRFPSLIC